MPNLVLETKCGDDDMAVVLRNVCKSYGKGKTPILDKLNMVVPRGCIYGLLGASGCGKTTLLNVVVGLLKLDSGVVRVLGGTPGKKNSGVPGPRVGFMPQEVALVEEFSVKGAIFYFGWLYGMNNIDLEQRFEFLSNLLELPPNGQLVKTLSGGQRRRVSFAAALVQNPELLILDEPTVGLDPVLRQNIWDYLMELSSERNMTIVITTHYIEEAKQAHKVGLLRNGTLLAETSPSRLLTQFNCGSLEEVFLLLSQRQSDTVNEQSRDGNQLQLVDNMQDKLRKPSTPSPTHGISIIDANGSLNLHEFVVKPFTEKLMDRPKRSYQARMKALLYKNFLKIFRNTPGMVFIFMFPLIEIVTFFLAVGGEPYQLPIAIVNEELGNCYTLPGGFRNHSSVELLGETYEDCQFKGLSCLYIDKLDGRTTVNLFYDTLEEGIRATEKGHTMSTLHFHKNFTEAMELRHKDGMDATNWTLERSEMRVWMDMSDYQIGTSLKTHFLDKYIELAEYVAAQCNVTQKAAQLPIRFYDPVYGKKDPSFAMFMAPGMIVSLVFFLSTSLTATVIIMEKTEGVWGRNLVAGVTNTEILSSQLVVQVCIMIIQMAETLLIGFFIFDMHILGSVFAMLLLVFLQSLCGVAFGLVISVAFDNLTMANYASLGSFYPYILLSGLMWPLEGMPASLRNFSLYLPGTWATTALRNILDRGWGITHAKVYPGFVVSISWVIIFTGLSALGLKLARK